MYKNLIAGLCITAFAIAPAFAGPVQITTAPADIASTPATGPVTTTKTKESKKRTEAPLVSPSGEPIICKTELETGSIVRKRKKCYTQVEWDRIAEAARAKGQRMVSDHAAGIDCRESQSC